MSGQSSTTSVIIPVSLVAVCFLLLVNIWTSKTSNQALSEDVGRAVAELDMAQYQREFCISEVKQTDMERKVNLEEEENVKNELRKALEEKKKVVSTKNIVKTQLDQARAERENNKGSGRQMAEALEKITADLKKQETKKAALLDEKKKIGG
eukprot:TRINITY_DN22418_c0_g1_i1.p1 TRINITY_DN22418_c0_g1~~TRINITY_DN22418_c0_g1_i1.p1  ORF type:complete len:164 (-),score=77.23 TRINITY_DN22418_c0_g1_i1:490-945(-)